MLQPRWSNNILIGFYAVIWAKAKEELRKDYCCGSLGSSFDDKTPLLNSYKCEGM